MPKAEHALTTSTSRRALIGALPAVALAAGLPVASRGQTAAAGDDAELIRHGRAFDEAMARYWWLVRHYDLPDIVGDFPPGVDAEIRELTKLSNRHAEEIANLHATTMDGLRVKARVAMAYALFDAKGELLWEGHDELLAWSLARDLAPDEAVRVHALKAEG